MPSLIDVPSADRSDAAGPNAIVTGARNEILPPSTSTCRLAVRESCGSDPTNASLPSHAVESPSVAVISPEAERPVTQPRSGTTALAARAWRSAVHVPATATGWSGPTCQETLPLKVARPEPPLPTARGASWICQPLEP